MTVTIEFGTRNHFRFTETLSIERTSDRQWLRHDLTGESLGVKLMGRILARRIRPRSEAHTSELQSLMRLSYAVFCFKTKKKHIKPPYQLATTHTLQNSP